MLDNLSSFLCEKMNATPDTCEIVLPTVAFIGLCGLVGSTINAGIHGWGYVQSQQKHIDISKQINKSFNEGNKEVFSRVLRDNHVAMLTVLHSIDSADFPYTLDGKKIGILKFQLEMLSLCLNCHSQRDWYGDALTFFNSVKKWYGVIYKEEGENNLSDYGNFESATVKEITAQFRGYLSKVSKTIDRIAETALADKETRFRVLPDDIVRNFIKPMVSR